MNAPRGLDKVRGALREPCPLFDIDFSDNRRLLDLKDRLKRKPVRRSSPH
jgi:hypothetical protein